MSMSSDQWRIRSVAAVIFDLDGVIVDSEIWWHQERVAWAASIGRSWSEADTRAVMGANSRGWARIMRERLSLDPSMDAEIEAEIVARMVRRYRDGAPEIPGAVAAVRRVARTWPVAIASSAHHDVIGAALDATDLVGLIPVIVSSDEVAHGKPAPDVYLEAARRLAVEPADCVIVEDSLNGVRSGRAAGMVVVLVPNASLPPAPGAEAMADLVLGRLIDLDPVGAMRAAARPEPEAPSGILSSETRRP
jgi:beta-phosphoglucomutase-like phosphatase (HAD superfamily)